MVDLSNPIARSAYYFIKTQAQESIKNKGIIDRREQINEIRRVGSIIRQMIDKYDNDSCDELFDTCQHKTDNK